jgi:stearoyl-CoA desaturase (delta-9 desaturase)
MNSSPLAVSPTLSEASNRILSAKSSLRPEKSAWEHFKTFCIRWFDADVYKEEDYESGIYKYKYKWTQILPFVIQHSGFLWMFFVGWSPAALVYCFFLYVFRMFAVTGIYHRYFSHKTYKTSRFMQFVFGLWGLLSAHKGPLWWAAHHRKHHSYSDTPKDLHSPKQYGFFQAHIGWLLTDATMVTDLSRVPDLAKYPELRFLNRFDGIGVVLLVVFSFTLGEVLRVHAPQLHTNGWQLLVWGSFISTCLLYNGTVTINSLAHVYGSRRYNTDDTSRNNFWLALITLGEGWHNNHHAFQGTVRQGFYWWEIDVSFYILWLMSKVGLVWDLKPVPDRLYDPEFQIPRT